MLGFCNSKGFVKYDQLGGLGCWGFCFCTRQTSASFFLPSLLSFWYLSSVRLGDESEDRILIFKPQPNLGVQSINGPNMFRSSNINNEQKKLKAFFSFFFSFL